MARLLVQKVWGESLVLLADLKLSSALGREIVDGARPMCKPRPDMYAQGEVWLELLDTNSIPMSEPVVLHPGDARLHLMEYEVTL